MKPIYAYIFIKVAIGQLENVLNRLKNIEEAESIAVTTGEYDIVLRIKVSSLEELYRVTIEKIHKIDGIVNTLTHIIEKEI
ncbi:MAG: Lrp/AsnC family transcriptional regulator [Candidatus Asgardarchaeia archaeon]